MKKILVLLAIIILAGCNSEKIALNKWKFVATDTNITPQKKKIITPLVSAMFPSEEKTIVGETTIIRDTIQDLDAIDSLSVALESIKSKDSTNIDSVITVVKKLCKPKTIYQTEQRVDTLIKRDPGLVADLSFARENLQTCENEYNKLIDKNEELGKELSDKKDQSRNRLFVIIALSVGLAASLFFHVKKLFKL